jgi:hypothetical protein
MLLPRTSQSDSRATITIILFKRHVLMTTSQLCLLRLRLVHIPTPMYRTVLTPCIVRLYSLQVHTLLPNIASFTVAERVFTPTAKVSTYSHTDVLYRIDSTHSASLLSTGTYTLPNIASFTAAEHVFTLYMEQLNKEEWSILKRSHL